MIRIVQVPITDLKPDPNQPRTEWAQRKEHIECLKLSYAKHGIIDPIEVDEDNMIILGECRWRAAKLEGMKTVPVRRIKTPTPQDRLERQLIDDAQRGALGAVERMWSYTAAVVTINKQTYYSVGNIKEMFGKGELENLQNFVGLADGGRGKKAGVSELARVIGMSQQHIGNYLRFWHENLPQSARDGFLAGDINYTDFGDLTRVSKPIAEVMSKSLAEDRKTKPRRERVSARDRGKAVRKLTDAQITEPEVLEAAAKGKLSSSVVDDITSVKSPVAKKKLAKLATAIDDDVMRPAKIKEAAGQIAQAEILTEKIAEFKSSPEAIEANIDWQKADAFLKNHPDNKRLQEFLTSQSFLYFLDVGKAFCPICDSPAPSHLRFTCHPDKTLGKLADIAEKKHEEAKEKWAKVREQLVKERAWEK